MSNKLNIRASRFLIAYILAIPIFGFIYASIPQDFYQSTLSTDANTERFRKRIQQDLMDLVKQVYVYPQKEGFGYTLDKLQVTELNYTDQKLTFLTPFVRQLPRSSNLISRPIWSIQWPPLEPDKSIGSVIVRIDNVPEFMFRPFAEHREPGSGYYPKWGPLSEGRLFPPKEGQESYGRIEGILFLPDSLQSNLNKFISIKGGTPVSLEGSSPIRFYYLSAVTITTLGYGDIVPVTDLARFYLATEAIFGVIIFGLFLNAIARPK